MQSASKFFLLDKLQRKPAGPGEQEELLADIRRICQMMEDAQLRFQLEQDEDLVEATIFELEALRARYRYLLKLAKRMQLQSAQLSTIYEVPEKEFG